MTSERVTSGLGRRRLLALVSCVLAGCGGGPGRSARKDNETSSKRSTYVLGGQTHGVRRLEDGSVLLGRAPRGLGRGDKMPDKGAAGGVASITDALALGKVDGKSLPTPAIVKTVSDRKGLDASTRPRPANLEEARARALSDLASSKTHYRYEGALAARALRLKEAVPLLAKLARGSDASAIPAIGALGAIGGEEAARALASALRRQRETLARVRIIRALGATRERCALKPLLRAFDTDLALPRIEAALALGNLGNADAAPVLRKALADGKAVTVVKVAIASALARLGDAGGIDVLERAASSRSPELGAMAIEGLAAVAASADPARDERAERTRTRAAQGIAVSLGSPYTAVWGAALRAIARLRPVAALRVLDALEKAAPEIRLRARIARAAFGGKGSREVLKRALVHPAFKIRAVAAEILGLLGDRAAVKALGRSLEDPRSSVRVAAAWALGRLGDPAAAPALYRARTGNDRALAAMCARALGAIGRASEGTPCAPTAAPPSDGGYELEKIIPGADGKHFCVVRQPGGWLVLLGRGEETSAGHRVERIVAGERGGGTVFLSRGKEALTLHAAPAPAPATSTETAAPAGPDHSRRAASP